MSSVNSAQTIHDIRNALNVVMTSAQLLRGPEPLTEKQQKSVDRIMHASKEILALIGDHVPQNLTAQAAGIKLAATFVEEENSAGESTGELATENKILFVDDDAETLENYRQLLESEFKVETAVGGQEGLAAMDTRGPYAIIVSDMRMPGMSGIEFLAKARVVAPDTVRIMLTGHADVNVAIEAVNQDHIFRFLTKPCEFESLRSSLGAGLVRYRLVAAEKEILENTLVGGIKVLTDVLGAVSPEAFGRSLRITQYVRHLISKLNLPAPWRLEAAAMLSQLGCITLDSELLRAAYAGTTLSVEEQARFNAHPAAARDLLVSVPRLEAVAWMIGEQLEREISQNPPHVATLSSDVVVMGAKMLKLAVAFDALRMQAISNDEAIARLRSRPAEFEDKLLDAMMSLKAEGSKMISRKISVTKLTPGMILQQEIRTTNGLLIVAKGQEITRPLVARLLNFSEAGMIEAEILALIPVYLSAS
jgi:response regulator RpfG family c-di-GMP phosphodiesterase